MFLTRWLNYKTRNPARPDRAKTQRPTSGFRPGLESLDERAVPAASGFDFGSLNALNGPWALFGSLNSSSSSSSSAVATELKVVAHSETYAGNEIQVTVVAVDANGRPVRDYTGTVALTSSDTAATLPASYTFTAADHGRHTFTVTLATTGDQTITATDSATSTIMGSASVKVDAAQVATHFFVLTERDVYTGTVTKVAVAALDATNHLVKGYTGTVSLTSTDTGATLPASYTFTSSDRGVHVFEFTPSATGDQTITATDTSNATVVGSVSTTVQAAQKVSKLVIIERPAAVAGQATNIYVVAVDDTNHIVRNYTGTVSITSSDTAATLPASYTFTAEDRGVKALSVTLNTTGSQTVTATDAADSTLTATATVQVVTAGSEFDGFFGGGFLGGRPHHRF